MINNNDFTHLHLHTHYSILDGVGKVSEFVSEAKKLGFSSLAITDHGNVDGAIEFQNECVKNEISPIFGCELYIVKNIYNKDNNESRFHAVVLAKNEDGFKLICKWLTIANTNGFYKKPRISFKEILEEENDLSNVIFLTACCASFILMSNAEEILKELSKRKANVYYEIMPHLNFPQQKIVHDKIKHLMALFPFPLVATGDVHYPQKDGDILRNVVVATKKKCLLKDVESSVGKMYVRGRKSIKSDFLKQGHWEESEIDLALDNTIEIAKQCNFKIEKRSVSLPTVPKLKKYLDKFTQEKLLQKLCFEGYKKKFGSDIQDNEIYFNRFNREFGVITKKKFEGYFLIMWDLMKWCRSKDIMYGPRGSCGGCLVAYLLDISNVDPLKFNLLFERFLDEARSDFPDIDVDFEDRKRDIVKKYLEETYNVDNVAGISTFLTCKDRAIIRDVSRTLGISLFEVNNFAKSIPADMSIDEVEDTFGFKQKNPMAIEFSSKLNGMIKSSGQHPAAVIISSNSLRDGNNCVICRRKGEYIVNWGIEHSEFMGLIKFDILGLNSLSVLKESQRLIFKNHNKEIIYENLPLDDKKTYELISSGNTEGMFQISTSLLSNFCHKCGVNDFNDLVAALALVRPGPLENGLADEYISRKHGKKWGRKHEIYEDITKNSLGILCYQEQIMQIINRVAGLPFSIADKVRKIISKKKDVKELEKYREIFVNGCVNMNTFTKEEAEVFWEDLGKYASYAFNLSHSVSYAMTSYWTAYIKTHFPDEFIMASLNCCSKSKKMEIVCEAKRMGKVLVPPKVGMSDASTWKLKDNCLYIPFCEIKGIGQSEIAKCLNGKMKSKLSLSAHFKVSTKKEQAKNESKTESLLRKMDSFNPDIKSFPSDINQYLMNSYFSVRNDVNIKNNRYRNLDILKCKNCELINECSRPVLTEIGKTNITILGDAPGRNDDETRKPLIGKVGDVLWKELLKYKLKREYFNIMNVCRCYPSETKTPQKKHIEKCFAYSSEEIKKNDTKIILALGNIPLYAVSKRDGGIMKMSGKSEYIKDLDSFVYYCIHPSSVLRDDEKQNMFSDGIKFFANQVCQILRERKEKNAVKC